jgi:hypothetical protein
MKSSKLRINNKVLFGDTESTVIAIKNGRKKKRKRI